MEEEVDDEMEVDDLVEVVESRDPLSKGGEVAWRDISAEGVLLVAEDDADDLGW